MVGAPDCPPEIAQLLPRTPIKDSDRCPICRSSLDFGEFSLAQQSKAAIDTDHLDPNLERRHVPRNVRFVHHSCNTTKGDRSLDEFVEWMKDSLSRHGYTVVPTNEQSLPPTS